MSKTTYSKDIKKLKTLCKSLNVSVIMGKNEETLYDADSKTIHIDCDQKKSYVLITFIHEIGHAIQMLFYSHSELSQIRLAYCRYYEGKHSKNQYFKVFEFESEAWIVGKSIADRLDIYLENEFHKIKNLCLSEYKERG